MAPNGNWAIEKPNSFHEWVVGRNYTATYETKAGNPVAKPEKSSCAIQSLALTQPVTNTVLKQSAPKTPAARIPSFDHDNKPRTTVTVNVYNSDSKTGRVEAVVVAGRVTIGFGSSVRVPNQPPRSDIEEKGKPSEPSGLKKKRHCKNGAKKQEATDSDKKACPLRKTCQVEEPKTVCFCE